MKRFLLIATCAFAFAPSLSASAMSLATPNALVRDSDSATIQVGYGRGHMGHRGGRGHHYGWNHHLHPGWR
jgi:opacity protein-like surface antigen